MVGLGGVEAALERVGDLVDAEIPSQPELNPNLPAEGENIVGHVASKYGATREQSDANRQAIRDRALAVGFTMATDENSRIPNTFDAHRLLHWAGLVGDQKALKQALFEAYFTDNQDPSDHETLVRAAMKAGLDPHAAHEVLTSGRYAQEVSEAERAWQAAAISSVPAMVINERYLISGGQPAEYFEQALRQIAADP